MLAVILLVLTAMAAAAVNEDLAVPCHFYPVDDTDQSFQSDNGNSGKQRLSVRFPFFGKSQRFLRVNSNGHLTFSMRFSSFSPVPFPIRKRIIAPYWADADTTNFGKVFYRDTNDPAIIERAGEDVKKSQQLSNFNATMVFIATWYQVPSHDEGPERNTFQCVLITDGYRSFAMFNYGAIRWLTSSCRADNNPSIGYSAGKTENYFNHPDANTAAAINVELTSNTDVTGRWIFRMDRNDDDYGISPQYNVSVDMFPEIDDDDDNDDEDRDDDLCSCTGGNQAEVQTFAGGDLSIVTGMKTQLALWNANETDQCKFSLIGRTKNDSDPYFDWMSLNFGVHTTISKFSKSLKFGQDDAGNAQVTIRGQGYQGGGAPVEFVNNQWNISVGSVTWNMQRVNDNMVTVTPDLCDYSFCWSPIGFVSQWELKLTGAPYVDADLLGMCGSCENTTVTCFGSTTMEQTPENNDALAASCISDA